MTSSENIRGATLLRENKRPYRWRLRSRTDVIFRPADKGGAFVVWSKDLYLAEALKKAIGRTVLPANSRGCYRGKPGFGPFIYTADYGGQTTPTISN